mgnify:FL=1
MCSSDLWKTCQGVRPSAIVVSGTPMFCAASLMNRYRSSSSISVSVNRRWTFLVPIWLTSFFAAPHDPMPPENSTTC